MTAELLKVPKPVEGEEPEPEEDLEIPDVVAEMKLFAQAGLGLSETEAFRIVKSMHKLQQAKKIDSISFFGKVLGTLKDYYVVQAVYTPEPVEDAPEPAADVE